MTMSDTFVEIGQAQTARRGEWVCGDVMLRRSIQAENRKLLVLSDGMGKGVKANIMANLTASMALNFALDQKTPGELFDQIHRMLPECSVRRMGYATFTLIQLEDEGEVHLLNYENPRPIVLRGGTPLELDWHITDLTQSCYVGQVIAKATITPRRDDRIIAFSDGISQAGLGEGQEQEWGRDGVTEYIRHILQDEPLLSARLLAEKVVHKAELWDAGQLSDDASVLSLYYRAPRRLLLASGPPARPERDFSFAQRFGEFEGVRGVAGGTTADILARELNLAAKVPMTDLGDGLPPIHTLEGVDLVTEGVMTLAKVERLLRTPHPLQTIHLRDGAAERWVRLLLNADQITLCIGTATNEFHYDLHYKMRLQYINDIAYLLEKKHMKDVFIEFF